MSTVENRAELATQEPAKPKRLSQNLRYWGPTAIFGLASLGLLDGAVINGWRCATDLISYLSAPNWTKSFNRDQIIEELNLARTDLIFQPAWNGQIRHLDGSNLSAHYPAVYPKGIEARLNIRQGINDISADNLSIQQKLQRILPTIPNKAEIRGANNQTYRAQRSIIDQAVSQVRQLEADPLTLKHQRLYHNMNEVDALHAFLFGLGCGLSVCATIEARAKAKAKAKATKT